MSKFSKYLCTPQLKDRHFLSFYEEDLGSQEQVNSILDLHCMDSHQNQVRPNLQNPNQPEKKASRQQIGISNNSILNLTSQQHDDGIKKQINNQFFIKEMATPTKKNRIIDYERTTPSRKPFLRTKLIDRLEKDDVRIHEWTLRNLASQSYKAVLINGPTSYRQVADYIIGDEIDDGQHLDQKEKNNIKRRVYDALNVLIALGRLQKQGRKIYKDPKKLEMQEMSERTKLHYQEQIFDRKRIIEQKISLKKDKKKSLKNLKHLINRNKNLSQTWHQNSDNQDLIHMPFTAMNLDGIKQFSSNRQVVKIRTNSEQSFSLVGDLDCISLMEFNKDQ